MSGRGRGRGRERSNRGRGRGGSGYGSNDRSNRDQRHNHDRPLEDPSRGTARINTNLRRAIMSTEDGFVVSSFL